MNTFLYDYKICLIKIHYEFIFILNIRYNQFKLLIYLDKMESNNAQMQVIPNGAPQKVKISAKEFQAKYRSKRECYNFLACDVGVYLLPYANVTIYFLKELMMGKKKMLRTSMIRTIHIPQ